MNQKRSESFIKKVDANTEFLISKFTNIIALSASTSSQEVQASEMLQIELNAQTIVRLIEELLSVSRTLKESWILGQLPESREEKDPTVGITEMINTVFGKVLNSAKFDEEVEIEEAEEVEDQDEDEESVKEETTEDKPDFKVEEEEGSIVEKEEVQETNQGNDVDMKDGDQLQEDEPSIAVKEEKPEEPISKEQPTQQVQSNPTNNEQEPQISDIPNNDVIDISDNPNFDELDFESFGNMGQNNDDDDNNDIIMID